MPGDNDRGLQEISDAIDNAVDKIDEELDEHKEVVSKVLDILERMAAVLQRGATSHSMKALALAHVLVLLYGPVLRNNVMFFRMWSSVGWPAIRPNLEGLRDEYWRVRDEKKRNNGKLDMSVLLAAVDPQRVGSLCAGLFAGVTTCLLHVRSPYLQIMQAGQNLGEYVASAVQSVAGPLIDRLVRKAEDAGRIPTGMRQRVDVILGYLWTILGVYVANKVRGPLLTGAAVMHSASVLADAAKETFQIDNQLVVAGIAHTLTGLGLYNVFVRGGVQQLPAAVRLALSPFFAFESVLAFGVAMVSDNTPAEE